MTRSARRVLQLNTAVKITAHARDYLVATRIESLIISSKRFVFYSFAAVFVEEVFELPPAISAGPLHPVVSPQARMEMKEFADNPKPV